MEPNPWVVQHQFDNEPTYVCRQKDEANGPEIVFDKNLCSVFLRNKLAKMTAFVLNQVDHLSEQAIEKQWEQLSEQIKKNLVF